MSAYQYPAAAPGAPVAAPSDPTAVFGRRVGAIVVDFLLYLLIMAFISPTPLSPLAEYYEDVPDGVNACDVIRDSQNVTGCLDIGDRVYVTDENDAPIQAAVWLVVVLGYVTLQGLTGRTPGKFLFGVRAVDEQGATPGFGRSLLRTVLWIVDAIPYCIPGLVAFIVGLTSKGHRRVGDMAAKTFVVGKDHVGPVVIAGLTTPTTYGGPGAPGAGGPWGAPTGPGAGGSPWGGPAAQGTPPSQPAQPSPWGAPQQSSYPPPGGQAQPPPGAWGAPGAAGRPEAAPSGETWQGPSSGASDPYWSAPHTPSAPEDAPPGAATGTPGDAGPTAPSQPGPSGAEWPAGAGAGRPSGETPAPGTPSAEGTTPGPSSRDDVPSSTGTGSTGGQQDTGAAAGTASGYNPQWDPARGTYIVWEPQRQQWLGWDEASKQWRPL